MCTISFYDNLLSCTLSNFQIHCTCLYKNLYIGYVSFFFRFTSLNCKNASVSYWRPELNITHPTKTTSSTPGTTRTSARKFRMKFRLTSIVKFFGSSSNFIGRFLCRLAKLYLKIYITKTDTGSTSNGLWAWVDRQEIGEVSNQLWRRQEVRPQLRRWRDVEVRDEGERWRHDLHHRRRRFTRWKRLLVEVA